MSPDDVVDKYLPLPDGALCHVCKQGIPWSADWTLLITASNPALVVPVHWSCTQFDADSPAADSHAQQSC